MPYTRKILIDQLFQTQNKRNCRTNIFFSGLGEAYLFRHEFTRARTLMREQDDWCKAATATSSHRFETPFPEDLSLESLVALLRGDVLLNVHCYETQDIEAMVRHSLEFNFTISAFHHALDAYLVPDILRRAKNNITIATFADHWGYKKEAFQSIPEAPRILYDAGVPVAIKSDHPVLNSQHLVFEAAKTTHYGLPPQEAFNAVTSIPAKAIGLGHRIGSLKVGYDADIVVWDREPLDMGASPLQVYIDGVALFDQPTIFPAKKSTSKSVTATENTGHDGAKNYIVKNISYLLLDGKEPITGPIDVVVRDGDIVCSSVDCKREIDLMRQDNVQFQIYDVPGGYILPVNMK
jgi:hypothetical protein